MKFVLVIASLLFSGITGGNILQDCPQKKTALACRKCCAQTLNDDLYRRCLSRCAATYVESAVVGE